MNSKTRYLTIIAVAVVCGLFLCSSAWAADAGAEKEAIDTSGGTAGVVINYVILSLLALVCLILIGMVIW